jgi:hypothetical protein
MTLYKLLPSWYSVKRSVIKHVHLHFFLTLISLPILIVWGLPLSVVAPVGNFIFNFVLVWFLSLSSLIFFTELCGIPNSYLVLALEYLTRGWLWCLNKGYSWFLIGFATPSLVILGLLPIVVFILVHYRFTHPPLRNVGSLILVFCGMMVLCMWYTTANLGLHAVEGSRGKAFIMQTSTGTNVIDGGVFTSTPSTSWAQYTLSAELLKKTGSNKINTLILCCPSSRTFEAATVFLKTMAISTIFIPGWQGRLSYKHWKAYRVFKTQAAEHNCKVRFINPDREYIVDECCKMRVISPKKVKKCAWGTYSGLIVMCQIDNEEVTLYSSFKKHSSPIKN